MSAATSHAMLYDALASGESVLQSPASGAVLDMELKSGAIVDVANSFVMPDVPRAGFAVWLVASAAATVTSKAGVTIAILTAGRAVMVMSTSATTWKVVADSVAPSGFIDLPLGSWREIASNDITNAAGNGGILATDTTPTLEYVNGDTDSQIRMMWAASNGDPVARQVTLPTDLDRTQPIIVNIRGDMAGGTTDTPVIDIDTFFDEADTKHEDATTAFGETGAVETATIAAADIPDTASSMSIELTPGAHTTDALAVYAIWLTYTRTSL